MSVSRFLLCLLRAVGFVTLLPADAYAYVDPGTGSYLFQLAAAGLLAGLFTLRRCWDAVKSRLGIHRPSNDVE